MANSGLHGKEPLKQIWWGIAVDSLVVNLSTARRLCIMIVINLLRLPNGGHYIFAL